MLLASLANSTLARARAKYSKNSPSPGHAIACLFCNLWPLSMSYFFSLPRSDGLRKWFPCHNLAFALLFILDTSYHNGNTLFCRCPIKGEISLLAALIILAATDGKRDSPACLTIVAIIHIWDSSSSSLDGKNCQDVLSITCFLPIHFLRLHSGAINHFDSETPACLTTRNIFL